MESTLVTVCETHAIQTRAPGYVHDQQIAPRSSAVEHTTHSPLHIILKCTTIIWCSGLISHLEVCVCVWGGGGGGGGVLMHMLSLAR